jgi:hypothetical protein
MVIASAALVSLGGCYGLYRYQCPYGASHCCDLLLYGALEEYAATHGGAFPAGESSPEASLSLLYTGDKWGTTSDLLRGKTVPEPVARRILSHGGLLGPDSCGWHYVEGMRSDDDPRLALFWDKIGLGHNGQRLRQGGHFVMLLDGERKYVPAGEWDVFLAEQSKLQAARTSGTEITMSAAYGSGDNEVRVQLRAMDGWLYGRIWRGGHLSSGEGVAQIDRQPDERDGSPVLTSAELNAAEVETGSPPRCISFTMKEHQIIFDGNRFVVEASPR